MKHKIGNKYKTGEKVRYITSDKKSVNGIVKEISTIPDLYFVVYYCSNNWNQYKNYTGAATSEDFLKRGWK